MSVPTGAAAAAISSLLRCCVPLSAISPGKQAHAQILSKGLLPHLTLETDLLLMYSRCSDLFSARRVFDGMPQRNMHSWNIVICSYAQSSLYADAMGLLTTFLETGLRPDQFTFPPLFKACAGVADLCRGRMLHDWVVKLGLAGHVVVGSSVLDMYAKCGSLPDAYHLFVEMCDKDVVVWNSMISGFARGGLSTETFDLFRKMQLEGVGLESRAVPSVLSACGQTGDLIKGREIHGKLVRCLMLDSDITVGNSLIDMYAKCGCPDDSGRVFSNMRDRNLVTWTTLISSCSIHGKGKESLGLYEEMIALGFKPNCITFTSILSSCSHSGLLEQGRMVFESMSTDYGVEPSVEHYACMVDLLGRFGNLEEALELIRNMVVEPSASIWGALLGACAVHKNVKLAEIAAQRLFELEPGNSSNYVALCGIYDAIGMGDMVAKVRTKMRELRLVRAPGCSWITEGGRVHTFYQGGVVSHPLGKKMCDLLGGMFKTMVFSEDHYV